MKTILARAKPSPRYRYFNNLKNIVIEARLVGGQILYYEVNKLSGKETCLRQEIVYQLFHPGSNLLSERPFTKQVNRDFYAILNRHKQQYKERFFEIKRECLNSSNKTKLVRTRKQSNQKNIS